MKNHLNGDRDDFADGLGLGFDTGDERGEWADIKRSPLRNEASDLSWQSDLIIPKIGEVALLLGLEIEAQEAPTQAIQDRAERGD